MLFVVGNVAIGGDGCESGEEFLILPIESDSVAEEPDSSTLNRDSPPPTAPLAWSAISSIRKVSILCSLRRSFVYPSTLYLTFALLFAS